MRFIRHRWFDETDAQRVLDRAALSRIEARVTDSERKHSGEIRVAIEAGLPLGHLWRDVSVRERAVALFGELRVWDTEHNNGVLIYLLLAERRIEIVADRGIDRCVPADSWQGLVETMTGSLRRGDFEGGLISAIEHVDRLLRTHFAIDAAAPNPNELPDAPVIT